jgi:peroxiredoxin
MRAESREPRAESGAGTAASREPRAGRTGSARGRSALAACVLLVFLSLALCCRPAAAAKAGSDPLQALGLQAPKEAVDAPDFSLPDLSGKQIPLKQLRGKLVFLNFFATWCGPCREEMPGMERLHRAHQDKGLVVLAVNLQEGAKTIRPFVQSLKLSFPTVMDAEGAVSREYGVRALPVSFLIGRDGKIVWRAIGGRDWESPQARSYFAQLVAETR